MRRSKELAVVAATGVGLSAGWNAANIGAVAQPLAHDYGISLATVGLFTTVMFLVHLAMQVPGGKLSDRFGPRRMSLVGLAVLTIGSAMALAAPSPALALGARATVGLGTGLSFVASSDYIRQAGGSLFALGLFGGLGLGGAGSRSRSCRSSTACSAGADHG